MNTKIKEDSKGLYIRCDGWIGRLDNTVYSKGDNVRATHPAGNVIYVRSNENKIELWKIETTYWWHEIEGRGNHSKMLREEDLKRREIILDTFSILP